MASTTITTNADALKRAARKISSLSGNLSSNHVLNALSAAIAGPGKNWGFIQAAPNGRYIQPGLGSPDAPMWVLFIEGGGAYHFNSHRKALDAFRTLAKNSSNRSEAEAELVSKGETVIAHPGYIPTRVFLGEPRTDTPATLHDAPPEREAIPLTEEVVDHLRSLIANGQNMIISGVTGIGKTTLLQQISEAIPLKDRVICIEEYPELKLPHTNMARLHAKRDAFHSHIKDAARMKPDWVLLGEIESPWARAEFIDLGGTGHSVLGTMQANSLVRAIQQIELSIKMDRPQLTKAIIKEQIASANLLCICLHNVRGEGPPLIDAATVSLDAQGELSLTPVNF